MEASGHHTLRPPPTASQDLRPLLDPAQPLGQAYDALAVSLGLLTRPGLKTLLVTSTQPEEGKTTVVVGLALALARARKRVLVVDADLRRPSIHRMLSLENRDGLGALIDGGESGSGRIQTFDLPGADASGGRLAVVTAGPPTNSPPLQAAAPGAVASVLAELAADVDFVLIDSPPVLSVADPLVLAPIADGVVLVLKTGAVAEKEAVKAKERLERAGGRVLGVVMNRFDESLHGQSLHPYHAYYSATT